MVTYQQSDTTRKGVHDAVGTTTSKTATKMNLASQIAMRNIALIMKAVKSKKKTKLQTRAVLDAEALKNKPENKDKERAQNWH